MGLFSRRKRRQGQTEDTSRKAAGDELNARSWEDYICLNSGPEPDFDLLKPAASYLESDSRVESFADLDYAEALARDTGPLPATADREGYYGDDHFSYWASGYRDAKALMALEDLLGRPVESYLDLGCASGRVARHMLYQWPHVKTFGCDINRFHAEWCNLNLPDHGVFFHSHSIPSLPIGDDQLDVVSAFSVFTHIEAMETAWLMELRRILKPGGLAWITVHSEHTLHDMEPDWPLWPPVMDHPEATRLLDAERNFQGNRLVLRWRGDQSYASNVFYKMDYLHRTWGRIFEISEVRRLCPDFQDVLILRKPG